MSKKSNFRTGSLATVFLCDMYKAKSRNSNFWQTLNLLTGAEWRTNQINDVDEWVETVVEKREYDRILEENEVQPDSEICDEYTNKSLTKEVNRKELFKTLDAHNVKCTFNHPYVRSRLEKLMGSNLVNLTERPYMERLKERILEDYEACMNKRIRQREEEEIERVKNLVLIGKIPIQKAPIEMANHPIMIIEKYCDKLIAEHRAKIKIPKPHIPQHLYWDDTPDPPSGLSIENGHIFRPGNDRLCTPPDIFLSVSDEEDLVRGYMLTREEYDKNRYESDEVKELKGTLYLEHLCPTCGTIHDPEEHCPKKKDKDAVVEEEMNEIDLSVDEMYAIADEIILGIDRNLTLYMQIPVPEEEPSSESLQYEPKVNFN